MVKLPDGVRIEAGSGGLERLVIAARDGEAHIYTHGANVAHFQPTGAKPVLFVSSKAQYEGGSPGKAIRGGVPICFPWFGGRADDPKAPVHGTARIFPWTLEAVTPGPNGTIEVRLSLLSNDYSRGYYPHDFALTLVVTVGATLDMELLVKNPGAAPITFEDALHTYFAVSDIRQIAIEGLAKAPYIDKVDSFTRRVLPDRPLAITGETDRVFVGATGRVTIADPGWNRRIVVDKSGSKTSVVWNAWEAKAKTIADLGDDDWLSYVCVEAANATDDPVTLGPGATHSLRATIGVE
jgi:glucose-6-phosphate 1-epimerase